ncbi:MAG TPA: toll/interleukin-1 receptor domain-containing protein [Bryobacteraceae bacterium]
MFPCYAPGDREIAAAVAAFLERGADVVVHLDAGEIAPGEDLAEKARQAAGSDVALVLFSRHSLPPRWPRAEWEDALLNEPATEGVRIAFLRCDDCAPPRVLMPRFEIPRDLRTLKRWVRSHGATFEPPPHAPEGDAGDLDVLGMAAADRPGTETVAHAALAYEFAAAFREDFDEIFRVECAGRSLAALAGDLAAQLGLRLEENVESNLARLRDFCAARRFLFLLEGGGAPELVFGGRSSALIVTESGPAACEAGSLRAVQAALAAEADWTEICRLERTGRRLAVEQGRIAELYDLMRQWYEAAELRGDRAALNESARELVWILEGWGRDEEARMLDRRRALEFDDQMALPFER